jgi:hypothetical protein
MISLDATKNERADQLVRILCVPPDCTANAKQIGGEGNTAGRLASNVDDEDGRTASVPYPNRRRTGLAVSLRGKTRGTGLTGPASTTAASCYVSRRGCVI